MDMFQLAEAVASLMAQGSTKCWRNVSWNHGPVPISRLGATGGAPVVAANEIDSRIDDPSGNCGGCNLGLLLCIFMTRIFSKVLPWSWSPSIVYYDDQKKTTRK